jgi:hypothetical protein
MAVTINASTSAGLVQTADTSGVLAFQTNSGTTAVTIDTSQNVGIGTASPSEKLHVQTAGNVQIRLQATGANYVTYGLYNSSINYSMQIRPDQSNAWTLRDETAGANRLLVDSVGRLLVPSSYTYTTGNAANMSIGTNGLIERSTSSLKYKRDVNNATHGLAEVLQLRPVTYKGKSESDGDKIFGGLIAEEVHDAGLTEFVQYAEDGSPDALAYGNMVALCVKSIQELKAINDTQAETINALTARIVALEK